MKPMSEKNLPIKVIIPQERDIAPNTGRKQLKFFREITPQLIETITNKFAKIAEYYEELFIENKHIPAVGKLLLVEDAVAKSHRPTTLCRDLDIIGAGDLQELYIKITEQGLRKTIAKINSPKHSKELDANLTTIEDIVPIYADERLSDRLKTVSQYTTPTRIKKIKIKCYDFGNDYDNMMIRNYVKEKIESIGYTVEYKSFGEKLDYFKLTNVDSLDLKALSQINGIKAIDVFSEYAAPTNQDNSQNNTFNEQKNIPISDSIVGVIDSGISETSILNKYVVARQEFVAKQYQNRFHGTFVASCLQYGSTLDNINEDHKRYFKLVDIIALPNSDPKHGLTDTLSQDDFYEIVENVMDQYSGRVKIWNLSLGAPIVVEDDQMSDLAVFCDYIQDTYNVQLIIACGNYGDEPGDILRTWPPQDLGERDRVTVPADSARAISVGSIALKDSKDSLVKKGDPSPFSRRGPGSNYMVKPEVVDYGGNLSKTGSSHGLNVAGLNEVNQLVGGIGTSFATPKITYKYAKIYDDLAEKDLLLSKAFLIHNARINSKTVNIEKGNINYFGFGQPGYNTNDILRCSDNEITLVFKQSVVHGTHLEMLDFPFPKCLIKNGKYTGEIIMTLAYNPPVNQNYGSQYCRTNIDASFGTYEYVDQNKLVFKGQVPLEEDWADRYESSRIKKGYKWSPIKSYYRNLTKGIDVKDGWKIRIGMIERDELPQQEFVLIVTIRGEKDDPVYNDVVVGLKNNGFLTANLETQYQARGKLK